MWKPRTLLITDPNLGDDAHARLAAVCDDLTWVSWNYGDTVGHDELIARIAAGEWALAVSFYSDLVLPPEALAAIELPLNIHPALPRIRGVGHDTVPLTERHETVGPTLHRIEPPIDTGPILDVIETPLPEAPTYASLRALNQSLSLAMLDRLCTLMTANDGVAALERALAASAARVEHRWGAYYSRKRVAALKAEHAALLGLEPAD